ncbi:CxC2 domain-containing protein [Mycena chlorophos]|uniref:CxC2 domain-containing protein n=1 Tax=Mycena chlorophos TaxID=658473 RepID=A0A8H6WJC3_MYCCL|nr:CxC2 domain-containing protein [Mycena chlorophos]
MKWLWITADATTRRLSISSSSEADYSLPRSNVRKLPKVTAFDFYDTLERLTDGAGEKPPDRYRMLLRMARQWRHLLLLKRGGRFGTNPMGPKTWLPESWLSVAQLALVPGVNIPDDWQKAEPRIQCIFSQFFAIDACFQLKRRMVSSEARDPALGSGLAFMVESKEYREFLRTTTNKQEMSTCSGLKAVDHANTRFSKGYAAAGVGMVKGERYSNMDFIFASMLRHVHQMLRKVVSYDIVCQWYKKIFERLKQLPPFLKAVLLREFTRFVVPKLHILGHTAACKNKFDLNLIPGSGQTDAEAIERAWAAAGGLSGSTRMMGPGARSDMLDAYWSYWNWTKILGLRKFRPRRQRLDAAKVELAKQVEAFDLFSEEQEELVPEWTDMVLAHEADSSKKNPYVAEFKGETEAQVRLRLQTLKTSKLRRAALLCASTASVPSGFWSLPSQSSSSSDASRPKLRSKNPSRPPTRSNWAQLVASLIATSRRSGSPSNVHARALTQLNDLSLPESTLPEEVPLFLPSALAKSWRSASEDSLRNTMELLLRLEREPLRPDGIRTRTTSKPSSNQAANTRARTVLARNESQISLFADMYQLAWFAVLLIEDGVEANVGFQRLQRQDIRRSAWRTSAEEGWSEEDVPAGGREDPEEDDDFFVNGSNKTVMSWIWRGTQAGGSEAAMLEAIRIEWCKAWARVRRWDEEVLMLTDETRRVRFRTNIGLEFGRAERRTCRWDPCEWMRRRAWWHTH